MCCRDACRPIGRRSQHLQLMGRHMNNVLHKGDERSLSISPAEQYLDPAHNFVRVDLDACGNGGFIQDKLPQMRGAPRRLKGTERPIGVPQEEDRFIYRVYQSYNIFELPLDGIRLGIPTASTSSPINGIHGKVLLKGGKDGDPTGMICRCTMD